MFLGNLSETLVFGEKFADNLTPNSTILLMGPIGSGKTSLVQGIAKGLNISEHITSPTFALSHRYSSGKLPLTHIDLYRLDNKNSAQELFLEEEEEANTNGSVLIIEWPELIIPIVEDPWKIEIEYAVPDGRNYTIFSPRDFKNFTTS